MKWLIALCICAAVTGYERGKAVPYIRTAAQAIIDLISPEDRGYFITYHLDLEAANQGRKDIIVLPEFERIPEEKYDEFMLVQVPPRFSRDLLRWTEDEMPKWKHPYSKLESSMMVCFPSGCVDPNDVGQICCPF